MTIDEVRARHPDRVIRREGFTLIATNPEGGPYEDAGGERLKA